MPKSGYVKCPYFEELTEQGSKTDGKLQKPISDNEIGAEESKIKMFLHNICKTDCGGMLELYAGGVYRKYCFCPSLGIFPGLLKNDAYEEINICSKRPRSLLT